MDLEDRAALPTTPTSPRRLSPRRARVRLLALLASVGLLAVATFATAPGVSATASGNEAFVTIYEYRAISEVHPGTAYNASSVICYGQNVSNFLSTGHGGTMTCDDGSACWLPHICNTTKGSNNQLTWDNCISAIKWSEMPSSGSLRGCFYKDANYGGGLVSSRNTSGSIILSTTASDTISSFRWRSSSTPC